MLLALELMPLALDLMPLALLDDDDDDDNVISSYGMSLALNRRRGFELGFELVDTERVPVVVSTDCIEIDIVVVVTSDTIDKSAPPPLRLVDGRTMLGKEVAMRVPLLTVGMGLKLDSICCTVDVKISLACKLLLKDDALILEPAII